MHFPDLCQKSSIILSFLINFMNCSLWIVHACNICSQVSKMNFWGKNKAKIDCKWSLSRWLDYVNTCFAVISPKTLLSLSKSPRTLVYTAPGLKQKLWNMVFENLVDKTGQLLFYKTSSSYSASGKNLYFVNCRLDSVDLQISVIIFVFFLFFIGLV